MLRNGLLSEPGPVARVAFGAFVLLWASMVPSLRLSVARRPRPRERLAAAIESRSNG